MPGIKLFGVWFRPGSSGDALFARYQKMDTLVRASIYIEKEKLEYNGPEPNEVEEVLDARYELFVREIYDVKVDLLLCFDVKKSIIYILDIVLRSAIHYPLYAEACAALQLVNPVRERR